MKRLLYVVLLIAGAALVPVAPAQAAACSGTSGVTVVVQFPDGHIRTGCAQGDPPDGIRALEWAGFTPEPVPGQMGATVCQIDNQPAAGERCWQPPDYWAYFYARRGGEWTYSTYGAGSRDPKPGTVEGWKFGGSESNPPSMDPPGAPASPAPKPSPHPTAPHPAASRPTDGGSNVPVQPGATPSAAQSGPVKPGSTEATSKASATATTTEDGRTVSGSPAPGAAAVEAPTASSPGAASSSGGRSWIWGLGLVVALAAAAGTTAIRRRRG